MAFDPGLHSAQASGIPVTRGPYPDGAPGIRMSLDVMAQKIREGRVDPAIIGWAGQVCKDAGLDGRDRSTTLHAQGAALLDAVRAVAIYAPDAYGAEVIQSAAGTLCLRPNLCLLRGDCFPQGTLLLRDDYALVPIEEIKVGDRIWGHDKWTRVEAIAFKGKLGVDAIEMNNGSTMFLTGEHKVYAGRCKHDRAICPTCYPRMRKEKFERVSVSDLQEGEVLLQPDKIDFGASSPDPGRTYIDGLYLSEGWCEDGRFAISGRDGCRKEEMKREVVEICGRLGVSTYWHKRYVRINDAGWASKLAARGTRARFKNAETLNLSEEAATELLRGIMSDSTQNTNGPGRTYSTTSHTLMVQVRVLQRMLGVSTSVRMLTPEQHGGEGKHNLWRVGVRATNGRSDKTLAVKSIERAVRKVPCWDVQTEDHYVYLPENDVTVSNCDDLSVALGAAALSLSIPVNIVKQTFGAGAQEHVLIAMYDGNEWCYADPSTKMPFGQAVPAETEVWIDPMEAIGALPAATSEIVTLGRPSMDYRRPIQHQAAPQHWPTGVGATRIIWPADVVSRKNDIDAKVTALTNDIASCTAAPTNLSADWQAWVAGWKKFFCNNSTGTCTEADYSIWGLGGEYDDCEMYDQQVYQWQQKVAQTCTLSEPSTPPPVPTLSQQDQIDKALNVAQSATGAGVAKAVWSVAGLLAIGAAAYVAVKYVGSAKK